VVSPLLFGPLTSRSAEAAWLTAEGEAHLQANRNQEALQTFDRVLSRHSLDIPALVGRAEARRRLQQFEEALSDLNLALSLQPNNARALRVRSETNRDAGRKVRAWTDRVRAKWRKGGST
jgi:regulator of sirC expression with transglutaminase-like and TPR domain